ncbi:MAG: DnaJ domain-containing protein [Syntrophobacteraceae bacterium]
MVKCYYSILGLSVRATADEIKRSFRLLALRFHPDRNPNNPEAVERFRQALEAYETLVDPGRRKKYDRRRGYSKPRGRNRRTGFDADHDTGTSAPFEDVFEEYFGVRPSEHRSTGGSPDLRFDLQVGRSQVASGSTHPLEYVREVFCGACAGRGATNGKAACVQCCGSGRTEERMTVRIIVPPGCSDGACLRVAGAGDRTTYGLPAGDLAVYVQLIEGF